MEVILNLMSSLWSLLLSRTNFFCQEIFLEVERKGSNLEDGFQKKKKNGKFVATTKQTSLPDLGERPRDLCGGKTIEGCGIEKHRGRNRSLTWSLLSSVHPFLQPSHSSAVKVYTERRGENLDARSTLFIELVNLTMG